MARRPHSRQDEDPPLRRGRAAAMAADVRAAAKTALERAGFSEPALLFRWSEIAGPAVARVARPLRFSEKDGTLTLKAESGAALFLSHESRGLAGRVNRFLGREAVRRVKFVQGQLAEAPAAPPPPRPPAAAPDSRDPALTYRGPDGLKTALLGLARRRTRQND